MLHYTKIHNDDLEEGYNGIISEKETFTVILYVFFCFFFNNGYTKNIYEISSLS